MLHMDRYVLELDDADVYRLPYLNSSDAGFCKSPFPHYNSIKNKISYGLYLLGLTHIKATLSIFSDKPTE